MITFADYMDRVLYGPEGYYSSGATKSGKGGDYFTAPDVGPVFGQLLAEIFKNWQKKLGAGAFVVIEAGAGEGRLAEDILRIHPFQYRAVERSIGRLAELKKLSTIDVYSDINSVPPMDGVIFGNELIDAFPVHRVRMRNGKLEEGYVGGACWRPCPTEPMEPIETADPMETHVLAGQGRQQAPPTFQWASPSTPRLQSYFDRLGIILPEDYETEVNLAMADWLTGAATVLQKGLVVLIDYGRPAHEYYAPERTGGTLRAFSKHRVSADVLDMSGGADLTADVDFTSLALDAQAAGFVPLAYMEMGTFLKMGIPTFSEGRQGKGEGGNGGSVSPHPSPLALRYLLHPEGLGAAFHVLILGKNINPKEWTFEHNRLRRLGLPP